jgi:Las17-binding protein actin regulator
VSSTRLQLGAELGVAVGPVGRGANSHLQTGDWTVHPAYAYAISHGLFVGMSLEGSVLRVRDDVKPCFTAGRCRRRRSCTTLPSRPPSLCTGPSTAPCRQRSRTEPSGRLSTFRPTRAPRLGVSTKPPPTGTRTLCITAFNSRTLRDSTSSHSSSCPVPGRSSQPTQRRRRRGPARRTAKAGEPRADCGVNLFTIVTPCHVLLHRLDPDTNTKN